MAVRLRVWRAHASLPGQNLPKVTDVHSLGSVKQREEEDQLRRISVPGYQVERDTNNQRLPEISERALHSVMCQRRACLSGELVAGNSPTRLTGLYLVKGQPRSCVADLPPGLGLT